MRIKLLKNLEIGGHDFKANDVVNIHIKAAKELIEEGKAERYTVDDYIQDHIEAIENEIENEIEENAHQVQESVQITQDAD
jgi:hypothetical protein